MNDSTAETESQLHAATSVRAADLEWRTFDGAAGVTFKVLRKHATDGGLTLLIRFAPGSSYAAHRHPAGEEYYVLEGTIVDGTTTYRAGDFIYYPPGSVHTPRSETGCVVLVHLPAGIEFVTPPSRTRAVAATERRVGVGGFELGYRDAGAGTPLVLVHGFPFDGRQWAPQFDGLAEHCRVLAADLRGHGQSDAPPPPYSMVAMAEDLRVFLDRLDLEQVVLGGLSMGGYVVLEFADRYPERLAGLALLSTRTEPDTAEARGKRIESAHAVRREGAVAVLAPMLEALLGDRDVGRDVTELIRTMILGTSNDGLVYALEGMAARRDTAGVLDGVGCPALVMAGSLDTITPPAGARLMADRMSDAEFIEVPEAGHVLSLEQPDIVNDGLLRLIERVSPGKP